MKVIIPTLPISWRGYKDENLNELIETIYRLQNAVQGVYSIMIIRTEHSAVGQERWLLAV